MATRAKSRVIPSLVSRLKALRIDGGQRPKICLPEYALDDRVQEAAKQLKYEGELEIISDIAFLHEANQALAMGTVEGVVSGAVHSSGYVMRSALKHVGLRDGVQSLSSLLIIELPDQRSFIFSDCGVQIDPTSKQLAEIALLSAENCRRFLQQEPVVAMLSFSTLGMVKKEKGGKLDAILGAVEIIQKKGQGHILRALGELQVDAALVPEILKRKSGHAPECMVHGTEDLSSNILIFPDLNSGNIGYKLVEQLGGALATGPILQGLVAPSNDLSRACSVEDIKNCAYVTAFQSVAPH